MAFNFPTTGLVANVTTASNSDTTWIWTGTAWDLKPVNDPVVNNLTVVGSFVSEAQQSFVRNVVPTVADLSTITNANWKGLNVFVSETGALYYADGTAWNRIAKYTETGFRNLAVSGNDTISSLSSTTLTIVGSGSNRITTDSATNTITITGEATGVVGGGQAGRLAYYATTGSTVSDIGSSVVWTGSSLTIGAGLEANTLTVNSAAEVGSLTVNNSIVADGSISAVGAISAGASITTTSNAIVGGDLAVSGTATVGDPTASTHAATKNYVDTTSAASLALANARSIAMAIAIG
jgi:hypothetical protein